MKKTIATTTPDGQSQALPHLLTCKEKNYTFDPHLARQHTLAGWVNDEVMDAHEQEAHTTGMTISRALAKATPQENRRIRLAIDHLAAALGVQATDLRALTITPTIITARTVDNHGRAEEMRGRLYDYTEGLAAKKGATP